MEIVPIVFLPILFFSNKVSSVHACNGIQEINLQPYMGRKVAYPENYPLNKGYEASKNCSWKITAAQEYDVVVYPKWACNSDATLSLFYGPKTSAQKDTCVSCSNNNGYCTDIIQTRSSKVLLSLSTTSSFSGGGFHFRFMAVEKNRALTCETSGIRLQAEKTPKFITSPGFPANYQSNLNCLWIVEPASIEKDTHLVFEFRSQNLELGFDGCSDFVRIDGLNDFCEQGDENILQASSPMPLNSTTANVRFTSDIVYVGSGFVLAFYVESKVTPCSCKHGGTCVNSTCLCPRGYKGRNCENESLEILYFKSSKTVFREENEVLLESEITDNSNFTVQWSRNGILQTSIVSRYIMSSAAMGNGTFRHQLRISSVFERDEGTWSVIASNDVTSVNRSINIRVLPKLELQTTPQYDLSIESKENITLHCIVMNPASLINLTGGSLIWERDGKKILADSGFNISTTSTSTTLSKASAEVNDTGSYSCSHSTYPDPLIVSIYVNVTEAESAEILSFRISNSISREGKSVRFETEIVDIIGLIVQWFHNGNLITNSSLRYLVTSSPTGNGTIRNVLSISNVLQRDEGNWNITASNAKTTASRNIYLQVLPRLLLQMIPRNNLSLERKESINLHCMVTNPQSLFNLTGGNLFWQKDGKKLLSDSGFNISTTDTDTILQKSSAEVDDTGSYSCSHSAYPDPVNVSIYINVTQKAVDILSIKSSSTVVREGKSLRFESEIMDDPDLSVQWFHNAKLINNSSRYTLASSITSNGTSIHVLQISNVLLQDEGEWNVTASNGVTTGTKGIRIKVLPRLLLQIIPRNNLSIESKESINLQCIVTNPESLFNLTGGKLFWQKDGKKLLSDSGFNITKTDTDTTLYKSSAEVDDTGSYLCSHSTYPDPINVFIHINVTPKAVDILSIKSSSPVVREGKSLRIESEIMNDPDLSVQWFHNAKLINNSSRYTLASSVKSNGTSIHVLQISNVLLQDEGEWNVTASNGVTTGTRSIRIQVLPRLLLQMIPRNNLSIESKTFINLQCIVTNPESLSNLTGGYLFWQKDGKKISPYSGFHIYTTDSDTTLNKSSAEVDDTGSYSCSHFAYPDPINVSIYINVTPKAVDILSIKSSSPVVREGKSLRFESEIMDDPDLSVQWFHNGNVINNSSRYMMTSSRTDNGTSIHVLQISNVLLQDEGEWNVTAANDVTTESKGIRIQVLQRLVLQMIPQYDFSIQSGEDIDLHCAVINPKSLKDLTGGSLIWQKDGQKILSGFLINTTSIRTRLRKSSSKIDDSGRFSCSHSTYPDPVNVSIYVNVTETDKDKPCPCQHGGTCIDSSCACPLGYRGRYCEDEYIEILSFKSSNSVIREGKTLSFQAEIIGPVGISVQWFRNGVLIGNTASRYIMISSKTANDTSLYILNIASVLQRDAGHWAVDVSKGLITEAKTITVRVLPRLLLQMIPQYDFSIKSGESIDLRCVVLNPESLTGLVEGSLVCKKDGMKILSDSGFNVSKTNISISLKKDSAVLGDSGSFSCEHSTYPDPVFVSISISVIKPEQIRCPNETFDNIIWKSTIAGAIKKESCPENQKGTATRYCDLRGIWESPNLVNCTDVALVNANEELDSIIADGETEKVEETVSNTLGTMKNLTSKTSALSAGDISSSLDILEKIVNVTNLTSANIEKEAFFEVVDNVLSTNNSKSWTAVNDKTEKDASSLLKNMDRMSEVVLKKENITASNFKGKNFEVAVDKTKVDEKGIVFPEKAEKPPNDTSPDIEEYTTFLELPKQTNKVEKAITYVAVIYKTISDILPTDSSSERGENSDEAKEGKEKKKKEFVNSEILSLTTQTDLGILSPPLNLAFQHKQKNESTDHEAVCVSWDYTINKWSEKGCKVNSTNNKRTVCQCNHLTNFAILMRPYASEMEDVASLKTLSLVGVIISIAFTVLTFIIFILTWRHVRSDQNIMLLNLCGSLVVSYIVFIAAVEKTENEAFCTFVTALIQYLFLVTFFCMLSMGIYYCMSITVTFYAMYVANNFKSKSRVQWFLLGSWGIPLIISAITLGAFWGNDYHLKHYCWLSMESGSLYLFIVPVCLIAVINLIIMVSLIRVLCASSAMTKSSLQKKAASGLRSLGTLLPVLGVTWIFGVLAVNESAEIFQYIFIIANSLQGFCIFISHVLLNKKLMQGIKTKYPSLSGLSMFTETSKKETSSVSRSHSSRSDTPMVKPKKKRILPNFGIFSGKKTGKNNKVMKSNSFMTDNTVSTDCPCSEAPEKSLVMTENAPKNEENLKLIFKEEKTERKRPRVRFNINLRKKTYTVTET